MEKNNSSGCGIIMLIVSIIIAGILVYTFGLAKIIIFIIDAILFVLIAPTIIGLIWFLFNNKK